MASLNDLKKYWQHIYGFMDLRHEKPLVKTCKIPTEISRYGAKEVNPQTITLRSRVALLIHYLKKCILQSRVLHPFLRRV